MNRLGKPGPSGLGGSHVYLLADDDYHGGLSHAFSAGYQAGSNDRQLVTA